MSGPEARRPGRLAAAVATLAAAVTVAATGLGPIPPAGAEPPLVGVAITTPDGDRLDEGGSTTPFTLDLPDGATCPGDSAEGGYRINSYMVPATVAAAEVTFDGLGPTPTAYGPGAEFRQALFDLAGRSYVSALTAKADELGGPGPIVNVPAFDLTVYSPGDMPPGRYRLGLACTLLNEVVAIWDAQVEVVEDADDTPAGLHWVVVGAPPPPTGTDGPSRGLLTAVVAAGAAIALLFLLRRRRSRPARSLREAR